MLVVSDIEDVFLPKPTDLLVNLVECRASLESLLGRINDMFRENSIIGSAMGPALQAGYKLMVCVSLQYTILYVTDTDLISRQSEESLSCYLLHCQALVREL
jgi:protein transport protein SEC24